MNGAVTGPRVAAAPAQLELVFAGHPHAGTRLERRRVAYPYVLTSAFRLDTHPKGMLTAIVQSATGAILGEDVLQQSIHVRAGAAAQVTGPAALPVHRALPGRMAREDVSLQVDEAGLLEYLPSPRILFPGASLAQRLELTVAHGGVAMLADGFCTHRPQPAWSPPSQGAPASTRDRGADEGSGDGGRSVDPCFDRYSNSIEIRRPDGRRLAWERYDVRGAMLARGLQGGFAAHGVLLVIADGAVEPLAAALQVLRLRERIYAAASALPGNVGVALRVSASDGAALRDALTAGWRAARHRLTGHEPGDRRFT